MTKKVDLNSVEEKLSENNYIPTENISTVTFLAITLKKPILVEGPPGTGKHSLLNLFQMHLKEIFSEYSAMKE